MEITKQIQELIANGALFVCNHSGGKDSQAMQIKLEEIIPKNQMVVIHAVLRDVTWSGDIEHIKKNLSGIAYIEAHARRSLLEMIDERGMFPSPKNRQCTSDLKRGPIEREIRRYIKREKLSGLVVNCMGLRAEESSSRKKMDTFKFNKGNSKAGRQWYDWLPIHELTKKEIFQVIEAAGQEPHWVYAAGMSRLSCCFCIMASEDDLRTAAKLNPVLFKKYLELEDKFQVSMMMPQKNKSMFLKDIITRGGD